MRVSLTMFVDFVITSGSPKLTKVRTAKRRMSEEYDPRTDYWKPLRDRIVDFHKNGETNKKLLDDVLPRVSDKKQERYRECLRGYKEFLGRRSYEWFDPPKSRWGPGELSVTVNPELGLIGNGERGVVKLYFKKEKLSKRRVDAILLLMREGLKGRLGQNSFVGVLDVPRGRLYSASQPDGGLLPLLEGEAESFARIWNRI